MKLNIFFLLLFFTLSYCYTSHAATSVTNQSGEGNQYSYEGTEITPEDMQSYFPAPLEGSAPRMHFVPNVAPLIPVLPMQSNEQDNTENTIALPPQNAIVQPVTPQTPQITQNNTQHTTQNITPQDIVQYTQNLQNIMQNGNTETTVEQNVNGENSSFDPFANVLNSGILPFNDNGEFPALEIMIGQMVMGGFTGTELESNSPIVNLIAQGKIGGVFLKAVPEVSEHEMTLASSGADAEVMAAMAEFGLADLSTLNSPTLASLGNIASPHQLTILTAVLQSAVPENVPPLWIAIEQEGGQVQSLRPDLGFTGLASAAVLGQGSIEDTEIAARQAGLEMAGFGINFVLGPAGDVNVNPLSESIGKRFRSFGTNAQQVTEHVMAFGNGLLATNVFPCVRNFPGTGSYVGGFSTPLFTMAQEPLANGMQNIMDTLPDISTMWQRSEMIPYSEIISKGWNGAFQPALVYHRSFDALRPIPLSQTVLNGLLRRQMGFDGIVISQDLRALQSFYSLEDSILYSISAGVDILLISEPQNSVDSPNASILESLGISSETGAFSLFDGGSLSEADLTSIFSEQGLGSVLPGAFGAGVSSAPQTGIANQAMQVYETLLNLVRSGRISEERVRQSWQRIKAAKMRIGLIEGEE